MPTEPEPDDRPDLPPGLAPAWGAAPLRPRRGPKPSHSLDRIVTAAVELADADGLAAASLPNIAASVGLSTNALYRYVGSKEELLVLLGDAGFGPPSPLTPDADWRGAAREWVYAALDRYRGRPWLLDLGSRGSAVTPNRLRWIEQLLAVLAEAGMSDVDAFGSALLLGDFARATADRLRARADPDSADSPARARDVRAFLRPLLAEGGYPQLAELAARGEYPGGGSVDFGLDRVLDGIAGLLTASPA
ncbi:DNA-binding transcriptional regulator, AcrR family [Amycolatopsis tolypomycina]|uniref:DNA-binding transcriptional regulator, AcrR family n=1 Tax=Amycolatopsis tolypomycina TaxID=208445 RepID=A0A1H4XLD8_9PSEU|nr:TetR family transcriptional regulator [Amycolatopsis tolypomycina]SED06479.1 DNA-binding transcriptional regulator, AcrR family [Amycolatopsis tolypomycina]